MAPGQTGYPPTALVHPTLGPAVTSASVVPPATTVGGTSSAGDRSGLPGSLTRATTGMYDIVMPLRTFCARVCVAIINAEVEKYYFT